MRQPRDEQFGPRSFWRLHLPWRRIRPDLPAPCGSTTYTHGAEDKLFPVMRSGPAVRILLTYSTITTQFTGPNGGGRRCLLQLSRSGLVRIRPSWHGKSLPDFCIAEINRRVTKRSTAGCRGSTRRATMGSCDGLSLPAGRIGRNEDLAAPPDDTTHEPCRSRSSAIGALCIACGTGLR